MFDLIAKGHRRCPHGDGGPMMVSLGFHSALAALVVLSSLLYVSNPIPEMPGIMAFVAAPLPPPPPPPPATVPPTTAPPKPVEASRDAAFVAPVDIPLPFSPIAVQTSPAGELGVPGGILGGVPGGVPGGVVNAPVTDPAPSPPPPPLPPLAPVRIGGAIRQPALVSRTEPVYPVAAVNAHAEGVVVLEAVVGPDGFVEEVRVLRSIPLLDRAALDAVRRWRYEPLLLAGQPTPFVLTVTVTFALT